MSSRLLLSTVLAALVFATAAAHGAEVVKLTDGRMLPGEVLELDDERVVFAPEQGGRMAIPWDQVLPISRYELWSSTLDEGDAAGRLVVARWALDQQLFTQARRSTRQALGLGVDDTEAAERLLATIGTREADKTLADIDALVESDELDEAVERIRRYLRIAPPGADADRVRARLGDVMTRMERRDAEEIESAEDRARERREERKERWLTKHYEEAEEAKEEGIEQAIEGFAYLAKGNQTRSRRALAKAEERFDEARKGFKRLRRALGSDERAEICAREAKDCDRRVLEVLIRWGRLEVGNKSWKRASPIVDRGLKIDPVQPELLELRKTIDANWIRRKLSDVTNAKGRQSN